MYQKEEIERFAKKYVDTGDEQVFETLIKALIPMIDVQLGKNYSSLKEFWDDLRQEVLLKLHKNREGLSTIKSISLYQFLYQRIRRDLFRAMKKYKKEFDVFNPKVTCFEDLTLEEKKKLGIEPIEEEDYD